ncbi:hypothetical protein LCGC14_0094430 [marine sediment metagenome]|uniref:Diguanylate cyclase n=1 Tax=marine sediment metagenome TaxID=412755 RepID=A0A0F9VUA5_9ZZZZ|nr:diguanylate cyclase [Phycisphaerae bacterium]HDZ45222.1 diguanylate cyclase [Phycisphaerae bacterium]
MRMGGKTSPEGWRFLWGSKRRRISSIPGQANYVRMRVLLPLMCAIAGLIVAFAVALYIMKRIEIRKDCEQVFSSIPGALGAELDRDTRMMTDILDMVARDKGFRSAFLAGDRASLLEQASPMFESLRKQHRITHFYFLRPDRVCFLRVHQPDRHGDTIDRLTAIEAQETGRSSYGLELGSLGTIALRMVRPWYHDGTLIGYIELGEEIEHITEHLCDLFGIEVYVAIHKDLLDRTDWSIGMLMLGRETDWDQFPSSVITSQTLPEIPEGLANYISKDHHDDSMTSDVEVSLAGQTYRVGFWELKDVASREIGDLIILRDVTYTHATFSRTMLVVALISLCVGGTLFALFSIFLRRVDHSLVAKTSELRTEIDRRKQAEADVHRSRDFLRTIIDATPDAMLVIDRDHRVVLANQAAHDLIGGRDPVVEGMTCHQVFHGRDLPCLGQDEPCPLEQVVATKAPVTVVHTHCDASGNERDVEITAAPIFDETGDVIQMIEACRDITDRLRAEEQIRDLARFPDEDPNPVLRIASGGGVLYANKAGVTLLDAWGCGPDTLVTDRWRELVLDALASEQSQQVEVVCREQMFSLVLAPVVDSNYVNVYAYDITQRKRAENEGAKLVWKLGERLKELQCLYGLSSLVRNSETWEEALWELVYLIPPAWQYPDITCCRIRLEGREYVSEPFMSTSWRQSSDLVVNGRPVGTIEVFYTQQRPEADEGPFLMEERRLIDTLAANLSQAAQRREAEKAVADLARFPDEDPSPVLRIAADGAVLYGNDASGPLQEAWGCGPEAPVTGQWHRLVRNALESNQSQSAEAQCEGSTYHLVFAPIAESDYVNVYAHDITERKNAEQDLQDVNAQLEGLVMTDPLTGLRDRRYFGEMIEHELGEMQRYGGELALMMLDVDHFKAVNDTYGHQFGDKVLIEVAKLLFAEARRADFVARWGGDEFVVLMPHTPLEAAAAAADRIREKVSATTISDGKQAARITVSAGIGVIDATEGKNASGLLRLSDDALYAAKHSGRNCTRTWKDIQQGAPPTDDNAPDAGRVEELQLQMAELKHRAREVSVQGIWTLIQALEARDPFTRGHAENVTRYAVGIAETMGLEPANIEVLRWASMVHDIGKIGVPDDILKKKTPFTEWERGQMQSHVLTGVRILQEMRLLESEIPLVRCHHERWDGKGYPQGLAGSAIPISSRIMAVADTLDAITSERVYRKGRDLSTALQIIADESGKKFDPLVVDALIRWVTAVRVGRQCEGALTAKELLETKMDAAELSADPVTDQPDVAA